MNPSPSSEARRAPTERIADAAQPTWFGDGARPIFGWFHPAQAPARDCAVVLCNPFGYDTMIAHYAYRHLAQRLARAGIATLRFDYFGTGDSAGDDASSGRVDEWLASIMAARLEVKRCSGARAIALFGLRFGGLLATASALASPVDDLILLGPPTSGRACVRELRALRKLQSPVPGPNNPDGSAPDDENFGFLMTEEMRSEVAKIEPLKISGAVAHRALVIARDDMDGKESALVEHLRACGTAAELSRTAGYSLALRGDPYTCDLPEEAWSEIVAWLSRSHRERSAAAEVGTRDCPPAVALGGVREEAVRFDGLFGMLTEPVDGAAKRAQTGILLLNIGANHHIGSNRMYVRWARDWATRGFRVLRFDLSGVGDSPVRRNRGEKEVYSPDAMPETREAMDFMESRGCVRMLLVGLCSGSYVAFHTAVLDPRVSGVVLVNQPVFHWKQGDSLELHSRGAFKSTNFYTRAAFDPETYLRALRGQVQVRAVLTELGGRLVARAKNRAVELAVRLGVMEEPDEIARSFRRLATRGCDTLAIAGSNDGALDVLERRVGVGAAKMRGIKGFRLEVFEGTDHTFTPREAQERLKALLTDHLLSRFG